MDSSYHRQAIHRHRVVSKISRVRVEGGSLTEMLSKGQVLLVNCGETVRLNCEFTADSRFNLFDNPVWWRKAQRHEETQVNMMANVLEPFESTRRFTAAFHSRPPNYTLRLAISGHATAAHSSVGLL